jgi:hypothetical protein
MQRDGSCNMMQDKNRRHKTAQWTQTTRTEGRRPEHKRRANARNKGRSNPEQHMIELLSIKDSSFLRAPMCGCHDRLRLALVRSKRLRFR